MTSSELPADVSEDPWHGSGSSDFLLDLDSMDSLGESRAEDTWRGAGFSDLLRGFDSVDFFLGDSMDVFLGDSGGSQCGVGFLTGLDPTGFPPADSLTFLGGASFPTDSNSAIFLVDSLDLLSEADFPPSPESTDPSW